MLEDGTVTFLEERDDEHPSVLKAAGYYQKLGGKCYKPTNKFLPLASNRYVKVDASQDGNTSINFDVAKRQFVETSEALDGAAKDFINDMKKRLQTQEMLADAEDQLRDKALKRMSMDGIHERTARQILDEMPRLFELPSMTTAELEMAERYQQEQIALEQAINMEEAAEYAAFKKKEAEVAQAHAEAAI